MSDGSPQVYFSYKWGGEGERIVDAIDKALKDEGIPFVRDKQDLGYKGRISSFMQEIGRGSCVVVVICDKYLTSPNTMYELVEMARNEDMRDRIFPVVLSDADIYDAARRLKYVKYWEDKKKELSEAIRSTSDLSNLQGITDDLDNYDRIRDHVSRLTSLLKDMNTLTPEMHREAHFAQLIRGLSERLGAVSGKAQAAGEGEGSGDGDAAGFELSPAAQALSNDLLTVMDNPEAAGVMVFLDDRDGPIDLAMFSTTNDDGSLECQLATNEQLPPALRLAASARRELVTTYDFAAPQEPGGAYLFATQPADQAIVEDLASRLVDALVNLYGIAEEDLRWRALPD